MTRSHDTHVRVPLIALFRLSDLSVCLRAGDVFSGRLTSAASCHVDIIRHSEIFWYAALLVLPPRINIGD